jgi:hypothetical protein
MTETFAYRPKFVDIRVKKPADGKAKPREPVEQACDYIGCSKRGDHKAPKSRERANEYWHFCLDHVADYNRRWNYFAGMTDAEFADYQAREEVGHRPTWTLRSGKGDRLSAAMRGYQPGRSTDPFAMFGSAGATAEAPKAPSRRLTKLQAQALETLSLDESADSAQIRARYAEQVKTLHPDSNGGDRGAEGRLQRVVQAYQTLKAGGLV